MWDRGYSLEKASDELELTDGWPDRRTIRRYVDGAKRWGLRRMHDRLREATGTIPKGDDVVRAYSVLCQGRNLTKQRP